jgi:hypothetical protein
VSLNRSANLPRAGVLRRQRPRALLAAAGVLVTVLTSAGIALAGDPAQAGAAICDKFGSTKLSGGRYVVQNNNWGDDTTQCISASANGFGITTASHHKATNGAPGSYPSIYAGCHYGNCSSGSGLPMAVTSSAFGSATTSVTMSYPASGVYDASYDLWFDPTPRTDGQNTGAELMVWLNHTGPIQPAGSKAGTVTLAGATWDVWYGNTGWNVISYVRTSATPSISFALHTFFDDVLTRGYAQRSWYLTSVQAGFEPWAGGAGLAVTAFSYRTSGGTAPGSTPPPVTTPPPATTPPPPAGARCIAHYTTPTAWPGGFLGLITVQARRPIKTWRISWRLGSGQSVRNLWGGRGSRRGSIETVTNAAWNGSLTAGRITTVAFVASGSPSRPTVTCAAQ